MAVQPATRGAMLKPDLVAGVDRLSLRNVRLRMGRSKAVPSSASTAMLARAPSLLKHHRHQPHGSHSPTHPVAHRAFNNPVALRAVQLRVAGYGLLA